MPSPKIVKMDSLFTKARENYKDQQGPDLEKLAFTPFNSQLLSGTPAPRSSVPKPMRFQALESQKQLKSALINDKVLEQDKIQVD